MPHLTSTTSTQAGPVTGSGFGIPGYAHPLVAPKEWADLARPGAPVHWAVLNVAGGPGTRLDPHCLQAAARLRTVGVRVLGHLETAHGARVRTAEAVSRLISDAHRYLDWYGVDGFLLDRCPADRSTLPDIQRTVGKLRALRDDAHIVLGHNGHPHPGYAEFADQLVTFRGPWSDYRWSQVAEWTADHPPERFCHFVHGVPRGHLDEALRIARWQGAATIYFTDRIRRRGTSPWETMPGYWDEIVSRIGTGVSE
ncbi:spherulation-specific family 4 protein [Streptomyces sp. NPDC057877]|uniref:spherulation-specific family 4 protein n=1 Tax=Streptomyces sp. NPDC057877 TaxID=3346269 RepID=UPI0036AA1B82